jgi:2-amino-4-hydroxy-6-hydroxymethyldihydropteridine diphosphokinase
MTKAVLSLGSNLGDRAAHLRDALAALGDLVMAVSGVYESPAWGGPGPDGRESPPYLNAVVLVVDDGDDPSAWLTRARELERAAGRDRDPSWRYAPRTLDVDVITVWTGEGAAVVSDDPDLVLPHPRAHERAFVLRTWFAPGPSPPTCQISVHALICPWSSDDEHASGADARAAYAADQRVNPVCGGADDGRAGLAGDQ